MSVYMRIFQTALRAYPQAYRQHYAAEMTTVFSEMLADAGSRYEKCKLTILSLKEILIWAPYELASQPENPPQQAPSLIKTSTLLIPLCIIPYFGALLYKVHMTHDPEANPALLPLEVHFRLLYAAILPSLAVAIAALTIAWSLLTLRHRSHIGSAAVATRSLQHYVWVAASFGLIALVILW